MAKTKKRTFSLGDEPIGDQLTLSKKPRKTKIQTQAKVISASQPASLTYNNTDSADSADLADNAFELPSGSLASSAVAEDIIHELSGKVQILQQQVSFLLSYLGLTDLPDSNINVGVTPRWPVDRLSTGESRASNVPVEPASRGFHAGPGPCSNRAVDPAVSHGRTDNSSSHGPRAADDFTLIVHRTLSDVSRRSRNVIVSGLPEDSHTDDRTAFTELCESNLSVKPVVDLSANCCVRIGRQAPDRPRRLLVRLSSEGAATDLLRAAPLLRRSGDRQVAKNVYINPDLSPPQARLAFEIRQKRRAKQQARRERPADSGNGVTSMQVTDGAASVPSRYLPAVGVGSHADTNDGDGAHAAPVGLPSLPFR